jgi:pimeloyl-ACP methyl ester carboxylesterase
VDPALPYAQEEVKIPSGSITLAGTLSLPHGSGPFPAIVLISGSGAQNRDESVYGFKPFAILADHLTRHGIAVLRCDDRGVGGSGGDFAAATSVDFAADLRAENRFLSARKDIDRRRIGALGHSEGGIIAPMVAAGSDSVAFLVLLGAPGIRGDSVMLDQADRIQRAAGFTDTARALNRVAQERMFAAVVTDRGWDAARKAVETVLRFMGTPDSMLASAVDAQVTEMKRPWMKGFLTHDPAPVLQKVRCPVLALFGANDLQVAPAVNAPPLERALRSGGNRDVTVRVIPRANHLFQETDNGSLMLYRTLKKEFVPGLLDTITTWVTARTRTSKR